MTAKVSRLRPKRHDTITEAIQLLLDLPLGLPESARDALANVLDSHQPPKERWTYAMLNGEQIRRVLALIKASKKPATTSMVWTAAASYVMKDQDGVCAIMASTARLAEDAGTTPAEVSRALSYLADTGALLRLRPGRYAINPHVGWNGDLTRREAAAKGAPQLRLVE